MSEATLSISPPTSRAQGDKREIILAAALRVISRLGLHNAPMAAVAKEAGVAAGTLYLYFPSKEAMINALYLGVLRDRQRAMLDAPGQHEVPADAPAEAMRVTWYALARWYIDHAEASNLIVQCRSSGILSDETRAAEQRMEGEGLVKYDAAVSHGLLRPLSRYEFWALFAGPIAMLVQMRESEELTITDDVLRATFGGVCRSVLPEGVPCP
jgi:AcrR family transcriptional regulator